MRPLLGQTEACLKLPGTPAHPPPQHRWATGTCSCPSSKSLAFGLSQVGLGRTPQPQKAHVYVSLAVRSHQSSAHSRHGLPQQIQIDLFQSICVSPGKLTADPASNYHHCFTKQQQMPLWETSPGSLRSSWLRLAKAQLRLGNNYWD